MWSPGPARIADLGTPKMGGNLGQLSPLFFVTIGQRPALLYQLLLIINCHHVMSRTALDGFPLEALEKKIEDSKALIQDSIAKIWGVEGDSLSIAAEPAVKYEKA